MRSYAPVSVKEIHSLVAGEAISPSSLFRATSEHRATHQELDEEEWEHLLSLEAAEVALSAEGIALVAVFESELENNFKFDELQCIFECERTEDGEVELIWFGATEVASKLDEWASR